MKKYRENRENNKKIKKISVLTLIALIICCAVLAFANIFGAVPYGEKLSASASAYGTTIDLGNSGDFKDSATQKEMQKLFKAISNNNSGVKSYKNLENYLKTSGKTALTAQEMGCNGTAGFSVKLGGYTWNAVYLSTAAYDATAANKGAGKKGDLILTLWLADIPSKAGVANTNSDAVQWNNWYNNGSTSWQYPSNMYSSSYIRAFLNGGYYAKSAHGGSISSDDIAMTHFGGQSEWTSLSSKYSDYLSTPAQLEWQKTENSTVLAGSGSYWFKNEAWGGNPAGSGSWYSGHDYTAKTGSKNGIPSDGSTAYGAWANDKLWLPSLSETGFNANSVGGANTQNGLWNLTYQQRQTNNGSGSSYTWLRSGDSSYGGPVAFMLYPTGYYYYYYTTVSYAVRPALHLNLKSAASAAGAEVPTVKTNLTYANGSAVAVLENVSENIEVSSAKLKQTDRNNAETTKNLTASDFSTADGVISAVAGEAGEYEVTFKLKTTVAELPVWDGSTKFDGMPSGSNTEQKDVLFWELPSASGGDPTYTIENQKVKFTISKATPTAAQVGTLSYTGSQLYSGGELPALTRTGGTLAGDARLDEGQTLVETTKSYNYTFYPTDDKNYNDNYKALVPLDVKKPEINRLEATFNKTVYDAALANDPTLGIYSSYDLARVKDIISKIENCLTISAWKEDNTEAEAALMDAIKRDYVLVFATAGQTALTGGTGNTLKLTYGGAECTVSNTIPVLKVELISIKIETPPTVKSYEALSEFNNAGMVVKAEYSDYTTAGVHTTETVTDYEIIYDGGDGAHTAREQLWYGDEKVTISYTETKKDGPEATKTATQSVTVNKIQLVASNIITLEASSADYDGQKKTVTPTIVYNGQNTLPQGVSYSTKYELDGNNAAGDEGVTDVVPDGGHYVVYVTLKLDTDWGVNYEFSGSATVSSTFTINPVAYESVDNIAFNDGEAQYSNSTKVGALKVTLPSGEVQTAFDNGKIVITYEYYSDSAYTQKIENDSDIVNMGDYYVRAVFAVDTNHLPIASKDATLKIIAHKLVKEEVSGIADTVYTGAVNIPENVVVAVELGGVETTLTENTDYTISYLVEGVEYDADKVPFAANTFVTVKVTGIGNFSDSVEIEYKIKPATLSLTWAKDPDHTYIYNGSAHYALVQVDENSVCGPDRADVNTQALAELIASGKALVEYSTDNGNAAVTAAGVYKPSLNNLPSEGKWTNYKFEFTNPAFDFTVGEAVLPTITFSNQNVTYDGETHSLLLTLPEDSFIKLNSEGKFDTSEITVEYFDGNSQSAFRPQSEWKSGGYNVRAVITLKTSNYHFSDYVAETSDLSGNVLTLTAQLFIDKKAIADESGNALTGVTVDGIDENGYTYNGTEQNPAISVTVELAKKTATLGALDYVLDYNGADHTNAGSVTVYIKGQGNYSGTIEKTFTINKAYLDYVRLDDGVIRYEDDDKSKPAHYDYTGSPQGLSAEFSGVADVDKTSVYPEIFYMTWESYNDGTYTLIDKPTNVGCYVAAARLTTSYDLETGNYHGIEERSAIFYIDKVDVTTVTVEYEDKTYYRGQLLPDLTLVTAQFNGVDVKGTVSWCDERTVLGLNYGNDDGNHPDGYAWKFTPTEEDEQNFNVYFGHTQINASAPTFSRMDAYWYYDGVKQENQHFLWTSNTLDDIKEWLWVEAWIADGSDAGESYYGRVTEYDLKGDWGKEASPSLAGYVDTRTWTLTAKIASCPNPKTLTAQFNLVTLNSIYLSNSDYKKEYKAFDKFDTDSISVVARYDDGSEKTGIVFDASGKNGYTVEYINGDCLWQSSNSHVTIWYNDGTVDEPKNLVINNLSVDYVELDTSDMVFEGDAVGATDDVKNYELSYDGNPHGLVLINQDKFDMVEVTYGYFVKVGNSWNMLEGVTEFTDAGEYRIEAKLSVYDSSLVAVGYYTSNYRLSSSLKTVDFTINKIAYAGAESISFSSFTTPYNGGDTGKLYDEQIKSKASGLTEELLGIITAVEYRYNLGGEALSPNQAVNSGNYVVTVVFTPDKNHLPVNETNSFNLQLTVEQITPTLNLKLLGDVRPVAGMAVGDQRPATSEGDTAGRVEWVKTDNFDPDTYVLTSGWNTLYVNFTPDDTKNYKTLTEYAWELEVKENYATSMYVVVKQGVDLYDSYTLEQLTELVNDEKVALTFEVYVILNTLEHIQVTDYKFVIKDSDKLYRDEHGTCPIVFTYEYEGDKFEFTSYVTVHKNGQGEIKAVYEQTGEIFTSATADTIIEKTGLIVESYYADGDKKGDLAKSEYELVFDWDDYDGGEYFEVKIVLVADRKIYTNIQIKPTLVTLEQLEVTDFAQNGNSIYASDDISALETMIESGEVTLTVTASYNDDGIKTINFGKNGYKVSIAPETTFAKTNTVTVTYGEGGIEKTATFEVEVTDVLVVKLYAQINNENFRIFTDTTLEEVAQNLDVTAYYNDGSTAKGITYVALELPGGSEKLTASTQVLVNVNYTGSDISADFEKYELTIGVVKHETVITFGGVTEYTYDSTTHYITGGATTNHGEIDGNPDNIKYEIDGVAASIRDAKEYVLKITSEETDDFYAATLNVTLKVNKADYDMSNVKFEDAETVYDGNAHYLNISGRLPMNVDVSGYKYENEQGPCAEASATGAGVYKVTVSFKTGDTENYNPVSDMTATLTIEKAEAEIDVTDMLAAVYTYDGTAQTVEGAKIVKADEGATLVYSNNEFKNVPAGGALKVKITVAESDNFKPFEKVVEIAVRKAPLVITAKDYSITYGDVPANGGVTADGLVNEEDKELLNAVVYGYDYSQYGNAGKYTVTASGVSTDNYEVTYVNGVLTVEKAEASVQWTVGSYVYDGKAHAPTAVFTDKFGAEIALKVNVSNTSGGIVGEAVSAGDYVATASTANPNYKLKNETVTFTIDPDKNNWIKFDFRKDYVVAYGSIPQTEEELAALAAELINQSFVRVSNNASLDLDAVIKVMTVRVEGAGNTPVTSTTPVGRYNIYFEFKPEYAEEYATFTVYQTADNLENTNIGRFVIEQRKLTLSWSETQFNYDGKAHLLTATVKGFVDEETPVSFTMTEEGGEFGFDIDGTKVKFTLTLSGDFTSVGGHSVNVEIDNSNYIIVNSNATASVAAAKGLSSLSRTLIGVSAGCAAIAAIAVVVAVRRKGKSGSGSAYNNADGFNDDYYGNL